MAKQGPKGRGWFFFSEQNFRTPHQTIPPKDALADINAKFSYPAHAPSAANSLASPNPIPIFPAKCLVIQPRNQIKI